MSLRGGEGGWLVRHIWTSRGGVKVKIPPSPPREREVLARCGVEGGTREGCQGVLLY